MEKKVDIIICVHDAYEDVRKCIKSVQKNTACAYRLIIVDDGSAEQTRQYLESVAQQNKSTLLLRNEEGHGYTVAVNMGIRKSTAEYVVLLNSDTEVPDGWLVKLLSAFKEDETVGIAGPISNTASWQSVPRLTGLDGDWCQNKLPEGMSVGEYSRRIEKYIAHEFVGVPLLNGFCMAVRRAVFDKIGLFDEEHFPRGYGEENDFNIRAGDAGFRLVVVSDSYVYHAQSKSYTNSTRFKLCEAADQQLRSMYGGKLINTLVGELRSCLELSGIRARVRLMGEREKYLAEGRMRWQNKKLLILLVNSSLSGGVNVIIQEAEKMREMGVLVSFYNLYENKEGFQHAYPEVDIPVIYGMNLRDFVECARYFDAVCATFNNTLQYFDFQGPKAAYYIQDFEPLFYEYGSKEYFVASRSYSVRDDVVRVTKTKWNAQKVYDHCNKDCTVIGPSVNVDFFRPKTKKKDGITRICAMVRPTSRRRGPMMTMQILRKVKEQYGQKVKIAVFGCDKYKDRRFLENEVCAFDYDNLGILRRKEMCRILQDADIFVDFSVFQAMGLTAMEAMACGCAVITTRNGGTDEYGIDGHNCLMIDTEDKEACKAALVNLIENRQFREDMAFNGVKEICSFYPEKAAYLFLEAVFGGAEEIEKINGKSLMVNRLGENILPSELKKLFLKCKDVYIYGAGYYAKKYAEFLLEEKVEFKGFVVSSLKENPHVLLRHKVWQLQDVELTAGDKESVGIIVAMLPDKGEEVVSVLKKMGYKNIYAHEKAAD